MSNVTKRSTSGFTLVEMLVVIVMIGILAAIAAPGWLRFANARRASAASDQILQAIRRTQAEAVRSQRDQTITFNTGVNPPTVTSLGVTEQLGQGQLSANQVGFQAKNGTTAITSVTFDRRGILKSPTPDQLSPQGIKFTVSVPATGNAPQRCVIIQTILGATRTGVDADCT